MLHFNFNGKIYKEGTAIVSPDNRGLRYGDGIFETIKLKNGRLEFADEHFERLWEGMNTLQFDIPKHFTKNKLLGELLLLAEKNEHQTARTRINVFRGDGGLYDAQNHAPNYSIQTWAMPKGYDEWNTNGLVLGFYDEVRKINDLLGNLKHNNYLPYVLTALKAKKEKWNDAILLNVHGRVCDTSIANIFLIKDNVIHTPELKEACVAGVMRKFLLQQLAALGYSILEKQVTVEEVLAADEIFLTNSMYDMRWVQRIGDVRFSSAVARKIFKEVFQTIS